MTLLQPDRTSHSSPPGERSEQTTLLTTLPDRAPGPAAVRRRLRSGRRHGTRALLGALAAALCSTVLLFGRVAALSGLLGFIAVGYLVFVLIYAWLLRQEDDGPAVRDALATLLMASAGGLVLLALVDIVIFTFVRGGRALLHTNFYTQDLHRAGSLAGLKSGGMLHAIVGTLWMTGIALAIAVPLGLLCAVYLDQSRTRFARVVRTVVEAMTALPSIVAGLFVFAVWELSLHQQKSGFAAAMALSVEMLPIVVRASDVVLRLVPGNLREAAYALGAPRWRTMWHVVLPTARSGLATAVILGTARAIGETSPVLLTAGYTTFLNTDPTKGPMVSLPLVAFSLVSSPQKSQITRGFGAAAFLLLLVILLFVVARAIGGRGPGVQTGRQRRRAARRSARDAARYSAGEQMQQSGASIVPQGAQP